MAQYITMLYCSASCVDIKSKDAFFATDMIHAMFSTHDRDKYTLGILQHNRFNTTDFENNLN